jgi:hypothetical protein
MEQTLYYSTSSVGYIFIYIPSTFFFYKYDLEFMECLMYTENIFNVYSFGTPLFIWGHFELYNTFQPVSRLRIHY